MKPLNQLLTRLRKAFAPRQGKKGSSLALVMMIGAVLVIWVMCIMPLMATTGTAAYQTQGNYDEYLLSRSVIEFCKSELEKIVEEKIPYTFAVTGDLDSGFVPVAKWNETGITVRGEYAALVNSPDPLDDRKDYPTSDSIMAICAVEPNRENPNIYDIVITTYRNCEEGMTYTATFTPKGSLLIYPEAYGNEQALPLSDFVVVDGKMGPNTVWNSSITMGTASSYDFSEVLLPLIDASHSSWSAGYANTGEYPAVFKTTANATYQEDANITDPVTMGDLTSDETWYMPTAGNNKKPGNIWYVIDDNNIIQIYMYTTKDVNITGDCTVYLNGRVSYDRVVPEKGIYAVSVDYKGTDYTTDENLDKYDATQINVLPINGLRLSGNIKNIPTGTQERPAAASVEDIEKVENRDASGAVISTTYTVTLTRPAEDLVYGCSDSAGNIRWSHSNVFTGLDGAPGKSYYFYVCRPAAYVDGVFMADSEVVPCGMIFVPQFVNTLNSGTQYAMFGHKDGAYYALNSNLGADDVGMNNGFIVSGTDLSAYKWTATYSDNGWSFKNVNNKYLTISGDAILADVTYTLEDDYGRHYHSRYNREWCYYTKCELDHFENITISLDDSGYFGVSNNGEEFILSARASDTVIYRKFNCDTTYDNEEKRNTLWDGTESYVNLTDSISASYNSTSSVKFMQMPPSAPSSVPSPSAQYSIDASVSYGTDVLDYVSGKVGSAEVVTLYANGQKVAGGLNSGVYHMVVKVRNGELETFANLGTLSIEKANLDASEITVSAVTDEVDELRIDVSAQGWHGNGGIHYFGYKKAGASTFNWYTTNDAVFTFRLKYGTYEFAVRESGTNNYNGVEVPYSETVEIAMKPVTIEENEKPFFKYTMADDGTIQWYQLPDGILPDRVHFMYGYTSDYYESTGTVEWYTEYKGESYDKWYIISTVKFRLNKFAIYVENSNYPNKNTKFEIGEPLKYNFVEGRGPSMMRGSSLYFMGTNGSINTFGNVIELTTDLLVLNSDIIGDGQVIVKPYGTSSVAGDTLLFVSNTGGLKRNGETIFEGRKFYQIPNGTDLCSVSSSDAFGWMVRGADTNESKQGTTKDSQVKYLFRQGVYPEINLDIAYASREQLSRIINSETIGWTDRGVLSGKSSSTNPAYVITAYVTQMDGETSYKANRILIAANTGSSKTLDVTSDLTLTTRYLSVDADQIMGSGTKFILNNLAQDQGFIQMLSNALGLTNYSSKSLQMDYERNTMIIGDGGTVTMPSQICRYDSGTNLLGGAKNMSLMAEYTTTEIENLFKGGLSGLSSTVKTVDRYVSLKADNEDGSIDIGALAGVELDIYANYIYIDSSVKSIKMTSLGSSDIKISSQESGYTTQEYLGIFKGHSAETYTGTILYFSGTVKITYGGLFSSRTKTIDPGFYWIEATPNPTSLSVLADNPMGYAIDPEVLKDYSVYINPDGTLSNAYVDTGLLDNNTVGAGGFSGGSMG